MESLKLYNLDKISETAKEFINLTRGHKRFAFYGSMGAGKTTFIIALCNALGAVDTINSPTFTIINEYRSNTGDPIYHLDFYRINNISELFDIGIEDYFKDDVYSFIEWPEKAEAILPGDIVKVFIDVIDKNKRELKIDL